MRKVLFISLAILLVGSLAFAHTLGYDPSGVMDDSSPNVSVPVYTAAALDAGDVVVLSVVDSTGDNDLWVATSTTAQTGLVAGVIYPKDIAAGGVGEMVIWGMAECDVDATNAGVGTILCNSSTAGAGYSCTSTDGSGSYAYLTETTVASGQGKCFVQVK